MNGQVEPLGTLLDGISRTATAADLRQLADLVEHVQPIGNFSVTLRFRDIVAAYPAQKLALLDQWYGEQKKARYVYVFRVDPRVVDSGKMLQRFKEAKESKRAGRAYARSFSPSDVWYVGSSGSLMSRVQQHLGHANSATTYAMQMAYWLPDSEQTICIQVCRLASSTTPPVLQALEDGLWRQLKPMLGKQGGK